MLSWANMFARKSEAQRTWAKGRGQEMVTSYLGDVNHENRMASIRRGMTNNET